MGVLFNKVNSKLLYPVNKTVDGIMGATRGLLCLGSSIFGSKLSVGSIMGALGGLAAGLVASILNSVTKVILKRVGQIVGSALSPINQIIGIINDLKKILVSIQKIINKATDLDNYISSRQNCSVSGANIFNCIAQSAINKISNKVAMDVDKYLAPIAKSVSKDSIGMNGAIHSQLVRSTEFLNKANLQQKLLS